MNIGRNVGFMRWYDRIPELSQAVRLMEKMPSVKQQLVADAIVNLMPLHQVPQRTDGLKKLGTEKVLGLLKSKVKRRWYDQDPRVHQAFNYLYLMDDQLRYEMAVKILICNKALDAITISEQNLIVGLKLVRSIFDKPLAYLKHKTQFVFQPEQKKTLIPRMDFALNITEEVSALLAASEKTARNSSDGIQTSKNSDMKIVRLKRVPEVRMG